MLPGVGAALDRVLYHLRDGELAYPAGGVEAVIKTGSLSTFRTLRMRSQHERMLEEYLVELEEGDVVYDAGANLGLYTCLAAVKKPSVHVEAFEPYQPVFELLRHNMAENSVVGEAHLVALGAEKRETTMQVYDVDQGQPLPLWNRLSCGDEEGSVRVDVRTLDGIIEGDAPPPDVLKIDVEGSELDLLRGAEDTLSSGYPRTIWLEVHEDRLPMYGGSGEQVMTLLREHGFTIDSIDDPMARKQARFFLRARR